MSLTLLSCEPVPVLPAPARAGLPDDVLALLSEMHAEAVSAAEYNHQVGSKAASALLPFYAGQRNRQLATAARVRAALIAAGCEAEAIALELTTAMLAARITAAAWPHPMEAA